jgi:hypothetical protein
MSMEPPDHLLKSALEKVVFFELRIEQLERDLDGAARERDRLKQELAAAAARELIIKQEAAQAQSQLLHVGRGTDEWQARAQALKQEREHWITKMIEGERIRGAGGDVDDSGMDLASFIAELRSEVAALREGVPMERRQAAPREQVMRSAQDAGQRLAQAGRLGLSDHDRQQLVRTARFDTRAEETVFAFSLRELSSQSAQVRERAAARLQALGTREAAAALASALNAEFEPQVKPALLQALAATSGPESLPLFLPHLSDSDVAVRLAALEGAFKLAGARLAPELLRALSDVSPRVRRRAALLAGSLPVEAGCPLLTRAMADAEAGVRRVAVLALATYGGQEAKRALLGSADDVDLSVRRVAVQGLSRLLGEPLPMLAEEPAPRRRRELRRLETLPLAPRPLPVARAPEPAPAAPKPLPPPPPAPVDAMVAAQLLSEISTSLRGRSLSELGGLGKADVVAQVASALVGQGKLVQRRERFFLA